MATKKGWQSRAGYTFECIKKEASASRGMVASNNPLASLAGVEMLALGGNAVDAAMATAFALTTVEPMMVGIFGAGFVLHYQASSGQVHFIDNYARAPLKASPDMYKPDEAAGPMETVGKANKVGHLSVGVPGALKAWCHALEKWGRLDLETVMEPAIRYAERGFPASPYLLYFLERDKEYMAHFPETAAIFLLGGKMPEPGQRIVRSDYARTLRLVAREGPDVLYKGSLGEAVAADMARNGGLITREDFARYDIRHRQPVRGTYRGYEIVSAAPTSSGGTHIVQALNMLEGFDVASLGFGTPQYYHLLLEVLRVCWADRFAYMGDPDAVDIPLAGLVSKPYAERRRHDLDLERTKTYAAGDRRVLSGESGNTTHFTAADAEGNVVTSTQTINEAFGSKVTTPGTGMLLNDCMALFDPHPGRPNSVGPGKRMLSSNAPTIVFRDGKPLFALGTPGGVRIFSSVLQAIINVIDHGMTLQEAVEAPRIWTQGDVVEVEEGVPEPVQKALESRGHKVQAVPRVAGGMNGVFFDRQAGMIRGAACWRADGAPVGISGGPARLPGDKWRDWYI